MAVRLQKSRGGKPLGEVEEYFASMLTKGDTFLIGGEIVRYEGMREMVVEVTRTPWQKPKIATFMGTKFATSTQLSDRILTMFRQDDWPELPDHTRDWLKLQREVSRLPERDRLLVESFPHDGREHLVAYGFAGKNAQQTLGLLLTQRMEAQGLNPMGFVCTDYATLIWGLEAVGDAVPLFSRENLIETMETWLADNAVDETDLQGVGDHRGADRPRHARRQAQTGRQTAFSTDILYDTLRKYDPGPRDAGDHPRKRRCAASSISAGSRRCWTGSATGSTMCA
jgi:ATP-dependent Lhr-like helicase